MEQWHNFPKVSGAEEGIVLKQFVGLISTVRDKWNTPNEISLLYLSADHSDDDVLVVSAAPAQDVGALLVALLTQFVGGVLRTVEGKKHNKRGQ